MEPKTEKAEPAPAHKWDLLSKVVTAIGALLAGVAIPIVINYNQEKNREAQLYVQIMTQREQSDSSLRSQMFNALIGSYFGGDVLKDPEKQMMYLHLLSLNFQEFFDARPLFEDLNRRVTPEQRTRLLSIAKDASDRQVNLLTKPNNEPVELQLCVESSESCQNMASFNLKGREGYNCGTSDSPRLGCE